MLRKFFFAAAAILVFAAPSAAQGPGPAPSPWVVNAPAIYYNKGPVGIGTGAPNANNALTVKSIGAATGAPLNIFPQVAPASPNNGDLWTTTDGVYARINGGTFPLGGVGATYRPTETTTALAAYCASSPSILHAHVKSNNRNYTFDGSSTALPDGVWVVALTGSGCPSGNWVQEAQNPTAYPFPLVADKISAAQHGTPTQLIAVGMIDSVASFSWPTASAILGRAMGDIRVFDAPTNPYLEASTGWANPRMTTGTPVSGTVTSLTGQFATWFTGAITQFSTTGEFPLKGYNGVDPSFTKLWFAFTKQVGGGTVQFKVAGALVGSPVSTAGSTADVGYISYDASTYARRTVSIVTVGGSVNEVYMWTEAATQNQISLHLLNKGGLSFADAFSSTLARTNLQSLLTTIGPVLGTIENKNDTADATQALHIEQYMAMWHAASPTGTLVVALTTPAVASTSADQNTRQSNAQWRSAALTHIATGEPVIIADKYAPFTASNDPLTAYPYVRNLGAVIYGDGTHYTLPGILASNRDFVAMVNATVADYAGPNAVFAPGQQSVLSNTTYFASSVTGKNMTAWTDSAGSGDDWSWLTPRSVGVANNAHTQFWRFGVSNTSLEQWAVNLDDDTGNQRRAYDQSSGYRFAELTDTGMVGGLMNFKAGLIQPNALTTTQINALPANSLIGSLIWDGTIGALKVAYGTSPTDWRALASAASPAFSGNGTFVNSVNNSATITMTNANAGTNADARLIASNGTVDAELLMFGTAFTTSGVFRQNGGMLYAAGAGGLTVNTGANQPIYFGINNTGIGSMTSTGLNGMAIGASTAAAVNSTAYSVGGVAGVDCTVGTLNPVTAIVSKGLVTHC